MFYGWYITIAGLISYTLGYGARYSFSIIFPALLEEFKWPRDATAGMLSAHILAYGIASPFAGYLVDRTGPRKTMVCGAAILSLGLILSCWAKPALAFLPDLRRPVGGRIVPHGIGPLHDGCPQLVRTEARSGFLHHLLRRRPGFYLLSSPGLDDRIPGVGAQLFSRKASSSAGS